MSGMEIHDRHQVEKSLLQWDVGDVSCPHLIHRRDLPVRSTRQGNRSDGFPGTVVRGLW